MVIGMITDRMTRPNHLLKDLGVFVNILPYHKERSLHLILIENSQHLRRHFGDWSVIESEIDICTHTEHAVWVQTLQDIF